MQVDVLGPLRVRADDREIDLGGPRSRALVARLALDAGRPVGAATLIDDLWGLDVPADATNALQSIVSRTRRRLPEGALESTPAGYVLQCTSVDAVEFERLVGAARVDEALALWRGEALADVLEYPFAASAAHRLDELRLTAVEASLAVRARSGTDLSVIAELADLTSAHPYRDGLWALYLTALAEHGRSNEALTAYDRLRVTLADELGADPSPELQELHLSLLRGEHSTQRSHPALPAGLTSFVGREGAIDDLQAALEDHRLVTILGPGGAGKTRLAVETARAVLDGFEDVWLTELAPVTGDDGIHQAILSAMGLLEISVLDRSVTPRPDERTRLLETVHDVEGLLLLDNCEHLIGAVAGIAEDLLAHAPKLRILATSREPLRIIGEFGYQLSPLTMPAEDSTVDEAMGHSAIQLFVYRAQTVDQSFALTAETLPAVCEICVRLDGQPLAIELAAARLRRLSAAQVAARLSDRFRLLTGGSRTALPRHRTLRAVVEWSWDLLDDAERDLAERLAVFPGGVTTASAAAVSGAGDDTEELLESLADKSLLVPVRGDPPRFRMLETLREYGVERLIERGAAEAVRGAHLRFFLDVAEQEAARLRGGDQVAAVRVLDLERANIMAALRFAIDRQERSAAARMVAALAWYWSIRNQHVEACTWADAVLVLPGEADPASEICMEALSLTGLLVLASHEGNDRDPEWQGPVDRILAIWDAHHPEHQVVDLVLATMAFYGVIGDRDLPRPVDRWTRSMINLMQLVMLDNEGRVGEIIDLLEPTIRDFRELGDRWGLAMALSQQGMVQSLDGKYGQALASWDEAIPLLHELGAGEDADFSTMQITGLRIALAEGDTDELRDGLVASLAHARRDGDRRLELTTRISLGHLEHCSGDDEAASEHLEFVLQNLDAVATFGGGQMEAVIRAGLAVTRSARDLAAAHAELATASRVGRRTRDMPVIAQVASSAAILAHLDGDDERAAKVLGASESIRGRADLMHADLHELRTSLRTALGDERYEQLHAEGRSLVRADAIDLALGSADVRR